MNLSQRPLQLDSLLGHSPCSLLWRKSWSLDGWTLGRAALRHSLHGPGIQRCPWPETPLQRVFRPLTLGPATSYSERQLRDPREPLVCGWATKREYRKGGPCGVNLKDLELWAPGASLPMLRSQKGLNLPHFLLSAGFLLPQRGQVTPGLTAAAGIMNTEVWWLHLCAPWVPQW